VPAVLGMFNVASWLMSFSELEREADAAESELVLQISYDSRS